MREQLVHRPLVGVLIGLCLGLSLTFGWWPIVFGLGLIGLMRDLRFGAMVLVALLVGFALKPPVPSGFFEPKPFNGVAEVVSVPDRFADGVACTVVIRGERYRLDYKGRTDFTFGDRINVNGVLGPLSDAAGYGGGVRGVLRDTSVTAASRGPFWWHWGAALADSFRDSAEARLSDRSAALVRGVCFNQTDGLGMDDWEAFRQFGIVHLLSASGFHVIVVAGLLLGLVSLAPIPRGWQLTVVFCALGLFAIAAGFKPPILRSVLMTVVALSAYSLRREADGLSAVAFAGVANLLFNPTAVVDLGFHLSMLSTLGLVMVITQKRWKKWNWAERAVYPTLTATAASFPLIGYVFGEVSLTGIIGNLVVAPLAGVLVVAALIAWGVDVVIPPVGGLLWGAIDVFAGFVSEVVRLGAQLPGGLVVVPAYSVIGLGCLYGLLVVAWGRYAVD